MIKRNKLSIFLLAVVMMLTVYYIKTPIVDDSTDVSDIGEINERYPAFAEKRMGLLEERTSLIKEQETIIASSISEVGINDRKMALAEIQNLESITETEVSLETAIIDFGYDDALVVISIEANQRIANVSVLSEQLTKSEVADIISLIMLETGIQQIVVQNEVVE